MSEVPAMMPKMLYVGPKEEIKDKELLLDLCLPDHPQIKFVAIVITFRNPRNPGRLCTSFG